MTLKLLISTLWFTLAIAPLAIAQTDSSFLNNAAQKLSQQPVMEKVYLHLDKPGGYLPGDTIWYKAYTAIGQHHQLSALSAVLYVELINFRDSVITRQTLHLLSGTSQGDIPLARLLKRGTYRLRAYTNWMRNMPGSFYDQPVRIGGISPALIKQATAKNPDIQFFPEGGTLIAGVRSKVAIKALNESGLGEDIQGTVEDNDGNVVANFTTRHLGMGIFPLTPQSGKTYKAKINAAGETSFTVDLPAAEEKGFSLALNNSQPDSIYVKVAVNDKTFNEQKNNAFYVIAQNNGRIYYSSQGKLENMAYTAKVEKKRFPTGITQFTLVSQNGEPLAERVAFIRGNDSLKLNINTDNKSYATRQKVKLNLQSKNGTDIPVTGSFSIAVINESRAITDENAETTIINHLLLSSELKGYIEKPNYYFINTDDQKLADLDVLMLTQGYRGFELKKVLSNNLPVISYQPEKSLELAGVLKTPSGKPVPNGKVTFLAVKSTFITDTITDQEGNFRFAGLDLDDTAKTVLRARKEHNGSNVSIYVKQKDYPPVAPIKNQDKAPDLINVLNTSDISNKNLAEYQQQLRQDSINKSRQLKEVVIKGKKGPKPDIYNQYGTTLEYDVDMQKLRKEYFLIRQAMLYVIPGVKGGPHTFYYENSGPVRVIVDGFTRSADDLDYFLPTELESVRMISATGLQPPTLVVTTKRYAGTDTASAIKLKEVKIKAAIDKKPILAHSDNLNGPGRANQIIMGETLSGCVTLSDCLRGKVFGVTFGSDGTPHNTRPFPGSGMVVIVDGLIMPGRALNDLNASDIYSIEVLRSGAYMAIYGSNAPNGALVITTRRGGENTGDSNYVTSITPAGLITYPFKGYFRAKTFYTPKYDRPKKDNEPLDLRSTIYWNPNVITDKDGKASFEYFNNDAKGTYRIVVEGIDDEGNLGRQVYRYKVE